MTLLVWADSGEARWQKLPGAITGMAAAILFGLGTYLAKQKPLRLPPTAAVAWQGVLSMIPVALLACFEHPDFRWLTAGEEDEPPSPIFPRSR